MNIAATPANRYASLDLAPQGEIAQELFSHVEQEARLGRIVVTGEEGSYPANLTVAMKAFYAGIADARQEALEQVAATLDRSDDDSDTHGVFLERSLSRIGERRIAGKREAEQQHREKNLSIYEKLDEAKKSYSQSRRRYAERMARHGREAKLTPKWYWPFLFLIGVAEMLVNFESFNAVPFFTPAIATGSTLLVAVGLAGSSHLHGTFLRQFHSRFGPQARDGDRAAAWRMFGLGTLCLSVVLAAVAYARNSYFADVLLESIMLGNAAPNWAAVVGGSMIMNVVVWIVGVFGAFLAHDEDHQFPDSLIERDRAEAKVRNLQRSIGGELKRIFERIDAEADNQAEEARNKDRSFAHTPEYATGRALFSAVRAQDAKVMALLEAYRGKLVLAVANKGATFERKSELSAHIAEQMSPQDYAAQRIELKYL